jgi:hypothetical protein
MQPAGYSNKPLVVKLGFTPGEDVFLINPPIDFLEYLNKEGVGLEKHLPADWLHGFFNTQAELKTFLKETDLNKISKGFWVSWPKKSSGVATDLTEQIFRDLILPLGWVDTKIAAIDETWSGLKFLRRKI